METRDAHIAMPYSPLSHSAWYITLMFTAMLLFAACAWQMHQKPVALSVSQNGPAISYTLAFKSAPAIDQGRMVPNVLSQKDINTYQAIFAADKKGDYKAADALIAKLDNKLLVGTVLAERFTNHRYAPTNEQLTDWLHKYNDHPKAATIYSMAMAKSPSLNVQPVSKQASLDGYGDDIGLARRDDSPYLHTWNAGIAAWKAGNKADAAHLFSSISSHKDTVSPWTAAAAGYWAWRAYKAIGNGAEAAKQLRIAANEPRTFYGILARRQLRTDLELDTRPITLTEGDVLEMISDAPIRRAVALTQVGHIDLAEKEMRMAFPQADIKGKFHLLALSQALNLASVQISMARRLGDDSHGFDFARYPIPVWQPHDGFTIDPALLFALMRQESGFRASAVSPVGALGLMQLMPQTASYMQKKAGGTLESANAADPVNNITLGQNYVQHLLDNKLVDGNLFYLLTAYNAGAGRLQDWKKNLGDKGDPLLFLESIPYSETRYYVMQVMTNYWIYSELIGSSNSSVYALLHGQWPSYNNDDTPVAARSASAGNKS